MKIVLSKKNLLLLFGTSSFIYNSVLRSSIFTFIGVDLPWILGSINIFAILAVMLLLTQKTISLKKINLVSLFLIFVFLLILYTSNRENGNSLGILVLVFSILPGICIIYLSYKKVNFNELFRDFLKFYNFIVIMVLTFGIIDYFLGGVINIFLARYMSTPSWAKMITSENSTYGFRMCTILGSPLMNAYYSLVLLVLNKVYEKTNNGGLINTYFLYSFCITTIALTGSRTALIIGLVYILFAELRYSRVWKFGFSTMIMIVILNSNLFQSTVGNRMKIGFISQSESRFYVIQNFLSFKYGEISLLGGGGYNFSRLLTSTKVNEMMNFEFPFLMFLFDYGIVATSIYYLFFLIFPVIVFLR